MVDAVGKVKRTESRFGLLTCAKNRVAICCGVGESVRKLSARNLTCTTMLPAVMAEIATCLSQTDGPSAVKISPRRRALKSSSKLAKSRFIRKVTSLGSGN